MPIYFAKAPLDRPGRREAAVRRGHKITSKRNKRLRTAKRPIQEAEDRGEC